MLCYALLRKKSIGSAEGCCTVSRGRSSPAAGRAMVLKEEVDVSVRAWLTKTYEKHLRAHILPAVGQRPLRSLTTADLERFRRQMLSAGSAVKTARDVIDGTFRALYRDARRDGIVEGDPFSGLEWPRLRRLPPDPFSEEERDAILEQFRRAKPHYYPFVFTQFWTGLRPGEAIGLRWGDIDLETEKLSVSRSRTLGEDNAPKTAASERTITLLPKVVEVLAASRPATAGNGDFVFVTQHGTPLERERWVGKHWHRALENAGMAPKKFYATRHTFISTALVAGMNIKFVAEYCGTSVAVIERHYGRYIRDESAQLALLESTTEGAPTRNPPGTLAFRRKTPRQVTKLVGQKAAEGGRFELRVGWRRRRGRRTPKRLCHNTFNAPEERNPEKTPQGAAFTPGKGQAVARRTPNWHAPLSSQKAGRRATLPG